MLQTTMNPSTYSRGSLSFRWAMETFFHWKHEPPFEALIMPLLLGAVFAFRPFDRWLPQYSASLFVGEDSVEARTRTGWFTVKNEFGGIRPSLFLKTSEESISGTVANLRP